MPIKDISGQRFGRAVALEPTTKRNRGSVVWSCICDCGTIFETSAPNLVDGGTRSCGCLNRDVTSKRCERHGHARNGTSKPTGTYNSWRAAVRRCTDPNNIGYPHYGAIGVKVCDRWNPKISGEQAFLNFLHDMSERPSLKHTLSRYADTGDYEPGNCAWHLWSEQRLEAKKKRFAMEAAA